MGKYQHTPNLSSYSRCSKILNISCLPTRHRETAQTQIRLHLEKLSDQGLPYLLFDINIPALKTNINTKRKVFVSNFEHLPPFISIAYRMQ